ncbi:heat shock protein 70 family [Talaromyces proteolyticus]|uniref:non-chaperonin molecular chaperone ATPase n=1 Tax=Talaromyces proteolyticus TaxID=1131652 RepID=A0AAD4KR49_9EURO|nr:heat shock protein 70 family [Talaromyces proteolyticus]KAH8697451.1 heat shock protein 70 family [Talaromyces proteolyticus]
MASSMNRRRTLYFLGFLAVLSLAIFLRPRNPNWPKWTNRQGSGGDGNEPEKSIGIELGDDYSRVGVILNDTFHLIPDEHGRTAIPSYVAFTESGTLVGFEAKEQAAKNPKNTIFDFRDLLGRKFSDPEVQNNLKFLPYDVIDNEGKPGIRIPNSDGSVHLTTAEDIASIILGQLKANAENFLGKTISNVVVSAPVHSYTDRTQVEGIKEAAMAAGFTNVDRVGQEPVYAGIGYKMDAPGGCGRSDECYAILYHVGERHSTVSVELIDDGIFEILEYVRERHAGSHDLKSFPSHEPDPTCTTLQCQQHGYEPREKIFGRVQKVLKDAKIIESQVDAIVLVGNDSQADWIKSVLGETYPSSKFINASSITPETAIVHGAAIIANVISNDDNLCTLSFPMLQLSIGIETEYGQFEVMMPTYQVLPSRREKVFEIDVADDQEYITVDVYEGQRMMAQSNNYLGSMKLHIGRAAKGKMEIEVSTSVDVNGKLEVQVKERNPEHRLAVEKLFDRYNSEELDSIYKEAEIYYEEDLETIQKNRKEAKRNGLRLVPLEPINS